MPTPQELQAQNGLAAMLVQLGPMVKTVIDRLRPVIDQPIIRFPYVMPLRSSAVIQPGQVGFPLPATDFLHALEWPFEVHEVKFSQDPAHTYRDWRVLIKDQTFNQDWMKSQAMVATLVDDNTGVYRLGMPWVVRPKGGGLTVSVDNLDTVNPITVDLAFRGYLMIPRA